MIKATGGQKYPGVKCKNCGKLLAINLEPLGIDWDPERKQLCGPYSPDQTFPVKCDGCSTKSDYRLAEIRSVDAHTLH